MITTFELAELPPRPASGAVVSIGVFDGVHLGHQAILAANRARAQALGARSTVVTFRAHPKSVLLGRAPRTLTSLEHRLELFRRAGIEHTLALTFDERLRSIEAETFAREILIEKLGARAFVLGFDSKFGRNRAGTPAFLTQLGFDVEVVPKVSVDDRAVSSTAIREAVELGDLAGAARMLGRPVAILGTVVPGDRLGRRLGFPTANLDLHHELHPPVGVWATRARVLAPEPWPAGRPSVTNIGYRPTITGERPPLPRVETHLIDGPNDVDLYGSTLEVEFVDFVRDERAFGGVEELAQQIDRDVEAARARLG